MEMTMASTIDASCLAINVSWHGMWRHTLSSVFESELNLKCLKFEKELFFGKFYWELCKIALEKWIISENKAETLLLSFSEYRTKN